MDRHIAGDVFDDRLVDDADWAALREDREILKKAAAFFAKHQK